MLLPSTRAQQHIVLNKTEVFWGGGKRHNKLCMPNACIQCFKINLLEAGYPQIPFLEGEEHQYRPTAKERMAAWQEEPRPWQAFTAGIFSPYFFAWIDSCPAWPRGEAQGWGHSPSQSKSANTTSHTWSESSTLATVLATCCIVTAMEGEQKVSEMS